jgi:hypothetical protein
MAEINEQCACITFSLRWGKILHKLSVLKVAFREQTVGRIQVVDWFLKPRFVVIFVEDAKCSGHPLNIKTDVTID